MKLTSIILLKTGQNWKYRLRFCHLYVLVVQAQKTCLVREDVTAKLAECYCYLENWVQYQTSFSLAVHQNIITQ
jgi:hypothetical protein